MSDRHPDEQERKALFAFLKFASSLTAWERLLQYHRRLVELVNAIDEAGDESNSWAELLVSNHAAMETAVDRLRHGDRTCFNYGGTGHFSQAVWHIQGWDSPLGRFVRVVGSDFPPLRSPLWPQIQQAMRDCAATFHTLAAVLEPRYADTPAPLRRVDDLYHPQTNRLLQRLSRCASLPDVPVVEPALLIRTRQPVTVTGIWEPVRIRRAARDSYELDGCMNYLHAGAPAPSIACPESGMPNEGRPTIWRFLWRDERYGDAGIPDEECDYLLDESHAGARRGVGCAA